MEISFRNFLPEIPPHLFVFQYAYYDLFRSESGELSILFLSCAPGTGAIMPLAIDNSSHDDATLCTSTSTADRKVSTASMILIYACTGT